MSSKQLLESFWKAEIDFLGCIRKRNFFAAKVFRKPNFFSDKNRLKNRDKAEEVDADFQLHQKIGLRMS